MIIINIIEIFNIIKAILHYKNNKIIFEMKENVGISLSKKRINKVGVIITKKLYLFRVVM